MAGTGRLPIGPLNVAYHVPEASQGPSTALWRNMQHPRGPEHLETRISCQPGHRRARVASMVASVTATRRIIGHRPPNSPLIDTYLVPEAPQGA
eukprot:6274280-Prymnesium_polylepis.1